MTIKVDVPQKATTISFSAGVYSMQEMSEIITTAINSDGGTFTTTYNDKTKKFEITKVGN